MLFSLSLASRSPLYLFQSPTISQQRTTLHHPILLIFIYYSHHDSRHSSSCYLNTSPSPSSFSLLTTVRAAGNFQSSYTSKFVPPCPLQHPSSTLLSSTFTTKRITRARNARRPTPSMVLSRHPPDYYSCSATDLAQCAQDMSGHLTKVSPGGMVPTDLLRPCASCRIRPVQPGDDAMNAADPECDCYEN